MNTTTHNDGGFAFPMIDSKETYGTNGMTLRDYFAAKAMQGFLAASWADNGQDIATLAYAQADCMILERAGLGESGVSA